MGAWWDGLWASNRTDDPLGKLDPKLREFLKKESPVKYDASKPTEPAADQETTSLSKAKTTAQRDAEASAKQREETGVPKESLFQDGRYAHLWKTYRPLAEIEAETKNDHEKLMDVLEGYKERKRQIGKAALENCALEQVDWRTCMTNPSFTERMTLCRDQVRKFEKCYMTQTRLLKALGYLSTYDRDPEVEEEIQMHADKLYHRMLAQQNEVEEAKKEGKPIPKFEPLVPKEPLAISGATGAAEELTPGQQERLKARLEKVAEEDRAAEEQAFRAELRASAEVASKVQGLWKQQEEEREARKERGEATPWDKVAGAFASLRSGEPKKKD
ncbi:hypothetical protein F4778DRAFT_726313 [Xylariomycetidae sp. FL2044]|nr:hypothetical protein F4778DRAFT_726313 [Xylariomycetidae sp. FL2044]